MDLLVVSQCELLISLLGELLKNTKVKMKVIKSPFEFDDAYIYTALNDSFAFIIDIQIFKDEDEIDWSHFKKISKNTVLLVDTKYQNPEEILKVQQAVIYLSNPLLSIGNINSNKQENEMRNEKNSLDLYLDEEVKFDVFDLCIVKNGEKIPLTNLETKILLFLYKNLNRVIETDVLMEKLELSTITSLYVHIKNLRNKIERNPKNPGILRTANKKGYMLLINP
ncbi:winged helix-turn-helix domain-containing protein [Bacillus thuringiensis]|uniref:winged helix-turn-helix domain-containing protein n=1 Tax=Bacillus thuringiensis TaxID=1428 RepID=UPI0022255962|nr:helix-turn-helix domain-containing protein [Bacillus thuringiensis]UYX52592.1 winged helix-turn-helix domain-containing protein [Bacillus thuringiensis]